MLGDLCRDLRFESKPVRFDLDSCEYFSPKHLVAGLHVRQLQVREDVREQRKHPVRNVVPEIMHALWPAQKSRAVHHVRAPVNDWLQQNLVITRVVFQVRVLHQHDISCHLLKTTPQRRSLSLVRRLEAELQIPQHNGVAPILRWRERFAIRLPRRHVLQNLSRPVRRAIIDDDHFLASLRVQHPPQDLIDRRFFVVNGNNNRHLRVAQRGGTISLTGHDAGRL